VDYGELNNRFNRIKQHFSTLTFLQVTALSIDRWGWHWWYLGIPIGLLALSWFDSNRILPKELDYIYKKSPLFMRMYRKIMREE
jgi:hypothetical protein